MTLWSSSSATSGEVDAEEAFPVRDPFTALQARSARAAAVGFAGVVLLGVGVFVQSLLPVLTDEAYTIFDFPSVLALLAGGSSIVYAFCSLIIWRSRYRAVRSTGWRDGMGTVAGLAGGLYLVAALPDGARALLQVRTSPKRVAEYQGLAAKPIKVGGSGNRLIVLLPAGYWDYKDRVIRVLAVRGGASGP
ncbi:hypothetical protein DL990_23995 [Amycolatopsis sp. WAC 01416]|nr:hypothetical protein DL990_23995 [Amycolatopsis sp. WAC 01416]